MCQPLLFGNDMQAFDEWLSKIDTQIFTDFRGGDVPRLNALRVQMIESIRKMQETSLTEPLRTMAAKLLSKLEQVSVREIQ